MVISLLQFYKYKNGIIIIIISYFCFLHIVCFPWLSQLNQRRMFFDVHQSPVRAAVMLLSSEKCEPW